MVVSSVGGRNLTLPERRSLSTSPWDLDPAEHILDFVALAVERTVMFDRLFPVGF
jgi:hypothetical protein